ncbi:protein of unknown function [Candidatus Filomicrobium marinum]|nr:protein of unknown function [Candidatus Filomicrobium marinum]
MAVAKLLKLINDTVIILTDRIQVVCHYETSHLKILAC